MTITDSLYYPTFTFPVFLNGKEYQAHGDLILALNANGDDPQYHVHVPDLDPKEVHIFRDTVCPEGELPRLIWNTLMKYLRDNPDLSF